MSSQSVQTQRERIVAARSAGRGATFREYLKLSGPGWLQSAITLGGGSLAGSLYLGIIGGYEMMWLQPLMMVFGVVLARPGNVLEFMFAKERGDEVDEQAFASAVRGAVSDVVSRQLQ